LDNEGEQIGNTLGKPSGKGSEGDITEEFIGLKPHEKIVGF